MKLPSTNYSGFFSLNLSPSSSSLKFANDITLYESANAHIVTRSMSRKNYISDIQKMIALIKKPVDSKILKKYKNLIHKQRVVMLIITALIYTLCSVNFPDSSNISK